MGYSKDAAGHKIDSMLQNRVDPFGNIIQTAARGAWTGTRGIIHNDEQKIIRPYKHKAWITCLLTFKGRKRQVMTPGRYTELFFLDEATAFAAGHRPCCECRRADFNKFKTSWIEGNPGYYFDKKTSINLIDSILQRERIDKQGEKILFEEDATAIPDGSFVSINNEPCLVFAKQLYLWSPFGYTRRTDLPEAEKLNVLTPRSIVNAFRHGYTPKLAVQV